MRSVAFRNDLEAARARVAALEERVAELEGRAGRRPSGSGSLASWLPLGLALALEAAAFLLAVVGADATAERVAWAVVALGLFAPAWSWGRAGRFWPFLSFAFAKATAAALAPRLAQSAKTWTFCGVTTPPERCLGVFDLDHYVFWYAPLGVLLVLVVEAFALEGSLRSGAPPPA